MNWWVSNWNLVSKTYKIHRSPLRTIPPNFEIVSCIMGNSLVVGKEDAFLTRFLSSSPTIWGLSMLKTVSHGKGTNMPTARAAEQCEWPERYWTTCQLCWFTLESDPFLMMVQVIFQPIITEIRRDSMGRVLVLKLNLLYLYFFWFQQLMILSKKTTTIYSVNDFMWSVWQWYTVLENTDIVWP